MKKECPNIIDNPVTIRMEGISVQHRKNISAPWDSIDGLESLQLYENCTENDFSVINIKFKNTEYERIINNFGLVRSRVMLLERSTNYSIHKDLSWRLHIPIETDDTCMVYFPDHKEHFYLEEGKVYKVNTTEKHTFMNTGDNRRIHFIGCLYNI